MTSVHPPFDIRIFHKECKSLVLAGYEVILVAPHGKDEVVEGIRIRAVSEPRGRLSRMTRTLWQVYREAVRLNADVYHFHDPELIPIGLLLRMRGRKVIYDIHENVPAQIVQKHWIPGKYQKGVAGVAAVIQRFAAKRFSAIVTADEELAEQYRKLNRRVVLIQNYPRLEEFLGNTLVNRGRYMSKVVVSFGGISLGRAIHELVCAMGLLPEGSDARLILGGAPESEALQREVTGMQGWERVDYRGVLPRQEMIALLGRAAAAVVLYNSAPNHFDVRSNRLFEALAAGLPVITPNFPKWREIVEGNGCGLAVDPENPSAIADAITYLLSHPKESGEMGYRAQRLAIEKFNWTREERKLTELYETLLDRTQKQ